MIRRALARLLALPLLGACGGRAVPWPVPPEDQTLRRLAESANAALQLDQARTAAELYARALARAYERDDPAMIADMAFGQATAALAHGDAAAALRVTEEVRAALRRRGSAAPPALLLAEATALHRLGQDARAGTIASDVAARGAEDAPAARRAVFLLGLIAATRADLPRLAAARAALGLPDGTAWRADARELEAHAAMLQARPALAAALAASAASDRQEALDYRGLSRALALQGRAMARQGDAPGAADFLLRAGRGAAERGEANDARAWLKEARELARSQGAARIAAEAQAALGTLGR